jgi:hypothetical protein
MSSEMVADVSTAPVKVQMKSAIAVGNMATQSQLTCESKSSEDRERH